VDFTTGDGSYFLLILAPESGSGTGYGTLGLFSDLLNTFSTLFTRYRIHSCKTVFNGLAGIEYVKFVAESVSALETSTGLFTYSDGMDVAVKAPLSTIPCVHRLNRSAFRRTGLEWMQSAAITDNEGASGTLIYATAAAAASVATLSIELDIEFSDLLDPNIITLVGNRKTSSPHELLPLTRIPRRVLRAREPEPDDDGFVGVVSEPPKAVAPRAALSTPLQKAHSRYGLK